MSELTIVERAERSLSFHQRKNELAALARQSERITAITNPDGYRECHSARMSLKNVRVEITKAGKAARDDANAFAKAVIAKEKELIGIIEPEESRLQSLQDAWDQAREAERQAKIEAERQRVEGIQKCISDIRTAPAFFADQDSDALRRSLADIQALTICDDFAEFKPAAEAAKADAISAVEAMIHAAEQREEAEAKRAAEAAAKAEADRIEAERMAAERAELDRQRAELEAQLAELRAQQEAEARAKAEAEAAQRAADEARLQAEEEARRAELERQREAERAAREAAEAQAKAARDAAAAAEAARIAAEIAGATLHEAASEALGLLTDLGEGEHIVTRKLAAALARTDLKEAA